MNINSAARISDLSTGYIWNIAEQLLEVVVNAGH